jgi:Virulence-associated protein E/Bifunctional DNA primase/polymerase, N-terminal/Primase C terminal 2 (PriCT-2)
MFVSTLNGAGSQATSGTKLNKNPASREVKSPTPAEYAASLGYKVHPLNGGTGKRAKAPYWNDWPNRSTSDVSEAAKITGAYGISCVGMPVIDLDVKTQTLKQALDALVDDAIRVTGKPRSAVEKEIRAQAKYFQNSPSGGVHIFGSAPAGVRIGSKDAVTKGIDVKAGFIGDDGKPHGVGQVVGAGSVLAAGAYRGNLVPRDELPEWGPIFTEYLQAVTGTRQAAKGKTKPAIAGKKQNTLGTQKQDVEVLRDALDSLVGMASGSEGEWYKVCQCLVNASRSGAITEDDGLELFDKFSKSGGARYGGRDEVEGKWYATLNGQERNDGALTLGSIFEWAKQSNWKDPRKSVVVSSGVAPGKHTATVAQSAAKPSPKFGKSSVAVSEVEGGKIAKVNGDDILWPVVNPNTKNPTADGRNVQTALNHIHVHIWENEFDGKTYVEGFPGITQLDDKFVRAFRMMVEPWGFKLSKDAAFDYLFEIARQNARHPVREYLDSLTWDGKPRVARYFVDYFGVENSEYAQAAASIFLVAAVRRVRQPGCKFDTVPVIEGAQGIGKSLGLRALFGNDWFTDSLNLGDDPKIVMEQTRGKWGVEFSELGGLGRRESERVTAQVSRQSDLARLAYERCAVEVPRQFVMAGTTNEGEDCGYLLKDTGNRRFLPMLATKVKVGAIRADRDQIWAEAAHYEAQGVSITLPKRLWQVAGAIQEARRVIDPIEEHIEDALVGLAGGFIPNEDIYASLGCSTTDAGGVTRRSTKLQRVIKRTMAKHGWQQARAAVKNPKVNDTTEAATDTTIQQGKQLRGYRKGTAIKLVSMSGMGVKAELAWVK